jgi:hypothetical protein
MTYTILSSNDSTPYEYGVAHSKNLSESGVAIFAEQKIKVPILMQLNITLPMRPFHLLILAKAVRCERIPESNLYDIGLKFVGILPPEFKRLVSKLAPGDETGAGADGDAGDNESEPAGSLGGPQPAEA